MFEAPINIDYKQVNAKNLTLKWSYDMDLLRQIEKQINYQQNQLEFDSFQIINSNLLLPQDQALIRNLYFELYLKSKVSNFTRKSRKIIRPFRTISAHKLLLNDNLSKLKRTMRQSTSSNIYHFNQRPDHHLSFNRVKRNGQETELITFEYNLTNLWPNTKYAFELSARMFNLESYTSRLIQVTTMRKLIFSFKVFKFKSTYYKVLFFLLK